jgi:hypothetical protein
MELVKKITIVLAACAALTMSCRGTPEANTLTLLELSPLPRQLVDKPAVSEYEPVYTVLKVVEISEINGVQRSFLVRFGTDRTGIKVGLDGDIAADAAFSNIIGICKVSEISGNFFRCQIQELSHKMGANAYVRIKTGERLKETSN